MKRIAYVTLWCLLALSLFDASALHAQSTAERERQNGYNVAVLSPNEGPLRTVGRVHDTAIKRALELEEEGVTVHMHNHTINILFRGTGNPIRDSTRCVQEARHLVENEQIVAILGPVSSDCTRRILSENLEVPLISSLSTAADLADRSRWFFRTIAHDRRRLQTFVDTARSHDVQVENSIAIYKPSLYARGLLGHVRTLVPSIDSAHTFRWSEVITREAHEVTVNDSFRARMDAHHSIANVFVLGSSDRMASVLDALDQAFGGNGRKTHFSLVGSTRYVSELPPQTWLIGEARVRTSRNLSTSLASQDIDGNLPISTLDAAITLEEAIRNVLADSTGTILSPGSLREALRRELERSRFRSSERTRLVNFIDGEVRYPPVTPIYHISEEPRIENLNRQQPEPWVEVDVIEEPYGHLAGPVIVELTPRGEDLVGQRVALQVEGVGDDPETIEHVELASHGTRVTFAPSFFEDHMFPSSFSIRTSQTPVAEWVTVDEIGWPFPYVISLLLAVIGALLYTEYRKTRSDAHVGDGADEESKSRVATWWWYTERCLAGLLIAFLVIHLAPLLDSGPLASIPIPQFGASWWVNAVVSGLLGGWLGLNPIVGFVATLIGGLAPLFQS